MSRSDKGVLRSNEGNKISQRTFWSLTLHPSALSGTFPFREGCLSLDCFNFEKTPTKPNLSCRTRHLRQAADSARNNGEALETRPTHLNTIVSVGEHIMLPKVTSKYKLLRSKNITSAKPIFHIAQAIFHLTEGQISLQRVSVATRARSSVGRVLHSHCRCREFESHRVHQKITHICCKQMWVIFNEICLAGK